jgi:hypothetical protein
LSAAIEPRWISGRSGGAIGRATSSTVSYSPRDSVIEYLPSLPVKSTVETSVGGSSGLQRPIATTR